MSARLRIRELAPAFGALVAALAVSSSATAGGSNCCIPNGTIGCDDPTCESLVCAQDSFCCTVQWDQICADAAASICTNLNCEPPPSGNDCCVANDTPGCDDPSCEAAVCAVDSFCCATTWDAICAGEAADICGICDGQQPGGPDRVSGTEKGSLLIFSKVEIRWDAAGNVLQDTFLDIANDLNDDVEVKLYFVNGDPSADAGELGPGERAHPGWNWTDAVITLTGNQPAYWSALTGQPGPGGAAVSPFTVLDPSGDPTQQGRPAPDGSGDRVLRGFVYAWAVNFDGCPIEHNHLKGDALLVNYARGTAWEYNAWASQNVSFLDDVEMGLRAPQEPGPMPAECGVLFLDGWQYTPAYSHLLLDFYAVGSSALSGGVPLQMVTLDTDLTLHPVSVDLRQETEGPVTTKANFVIWNEDETQLTGLHRCITCWDQTLLSQYAVVGNHFLLANLQTDKGKARIDGIQSQVCDVDYEIENPPLPLGADPRDIVSQDAALLGVHAKMLSYPGGGALDNAGGNLIGMGTEEAAIFYDAQPSGGGNPPTATGPGDRAGGRGLIRAEDGDSEEAIQRN